MFYLALSAVFYLLSHVFNLCAFICGLLWLVPLYFEFCKRGLTFKQGFCWGLFVYGIHFSWMLQTLICHEMNFLLYLLWFFIIFWFALSTGAWFFLMRFSYILSTLCFFVFLTKLSLVFCGQLEGYCLLNPLLCFVQSPDCLWIVQFFGDCAGFLLLIVFSKFFVLFFQKLFGMFMFLLLIGFYCFISLFLIEKERPIIDGILALKPWWYGSKSAMFAGYRMADSLACVATVVEVQKIHAILLPESTFCFDIDEYVDFFPIWSDGLDDVFIIFGTHRKIQNCYQNCVFVLKNNKINFIYDKKHLMPLIERPLSSFFIKTSKNYGSDIINLSDQTYQIFLCSELFFEAKPVSQDTIILLWNDSWLSFEWTKNLAEKFIKYFALKYKVSIIYVSTQGRTNISMIGN